jgi:hypothetical protein
MTVAVDEGAKPSVVPRSAGNSLPGTDRVGERNGGSSCRPGTIEYHWHGRPTGGRAGTGERASPWRFSSSLHRSTTTTGITGHPTGGRQLRGPVLSRPRPGSYCGFSCGCWSMRFSLTRTFIRTRSRLCSGTWPVTPGVRRRLCSPTCVRYWTRMSWSRSPESGGPGVPALRMMTGGGEPGRNGSGHLSTPTRVAHPGLAVPGPGAWLRASAARGVRWLRSGVSVCFLRLPGTGNRGRRGGRGPGSAPGSPARSRSGSWPVRPRPLR